MNKVSAIINNESDMQALALEIARNEVGMKVPIRDLLQQLNIDSQWFLSIAQNALFQQQVNKFKKELEENGVSFQLKARIQAEEMLKKNWLLVHDPDTPAAVAVKAIENTVRWAGLEPKTSQTAVTGGNQGFNIIFNIPELPKSMQIEPATIDVTPSQC